NSGMFVWRVEEILRGYQAHLPATAKAIAALRDAIGTPRYESVLTEVWEETDRTTIDYGIAEKAENVAVVPADIRGHDRDVLGLLRDPVVDRGAVGLFPDLGQDRFVTWRTDGIAKRRDRLGRRGQMRLVPPQDLLYAPDEHAGV